MTRTRHGLVPFSIRGDYEAQLLLFTNVLPNGCWEYTGYIHPTTGYGQMGRNKFAHRLAWEIANERPVPQGLHIDHQCHNLDPACHDNAECRHRRCVNPAHLEAVEPRVNMVRGKGFAGTNSRATHCPAGHEYNEANTYYRPDRLGRLCRICRRETAHRKYLRTGKGPVDPMTPVIRAWALGVGIPIATTGRIPRPVRELYDAAHSEQVAA